MKIEFEVASVGLPEGQLLVELCLVASEKNEYYRTASTWTPTERVRKRLWSTQVSWDGSEEAKKRVEADAVNALHNLLLLGLTAL